MSQERRYSFEFFPAKTEAGHEKLLNTARQLAAYQQDYFSCTYGAGGSTRERTHQTVSRIVRETSLAAAAHLTCVDASREEIEAGLKPL